MGKALHEAQPGILWYESNLLWGPVALGVGIVLAVIAAMKHDLLWLLWFAAPCLIFASWAVVKRYKSRWILLAVLTVAITGGLYRMSLWLVPAEGSQISRPTQASPPPAQPASETPSQPLSEDTQSHSSSDKTSNNKHEAEPRRPAPKRSEPPAAVTTPSQSCPNGICIAGENSGTATVTNNDGPPEATIDWKSKTSPTNSGKPGVKVIVQVDHALEIPAFLLVCNHPCLTWRTTIFGVYQKYRNDIIAPDNPNLQFVILEQPRPFNPGMKLEWELESIDQTPITVLIVRKMTAAELAKVPREPEEDQ